PLFYDARGRDRRDFGLLPLFVYSRRPTVTAWAVPLLLLGHSDDPLNDRATTVAGPIYVAKRGTTWHGGLAPLLFVSRSPKALRTPAPPLFHLSQDATETLLMATPLVWHYRDARRSFSLALPVFYDARGPGRVDSGILPLFIYSKRE